MIGDFGSMIVGILIIAGIVYFIRKTWQGRKQKLDHSNVMFVLSIVIALVVVPMAVGFIGGSLNSLFHPTPTLAVDNKNVKITGTNTKGTLKGTTRPNVKVNLKESDGIDHVKKSVISDSNGKFQFKNLESDSDFKLRAVNGPNKSNVVHVSIGDIPDSAYTQLSIDHSDDDDNIKIKQDDNQKATITGTATKNSNIEVDNNDYEKIKSIHVGDDKKWSLTLNGSNTKKQVEYSILAKRKGLQESYTDDITVVNPNYTAPAKKAPVTKNSNENAGSADDSNSDKQSKSDDQKLDEQTFVADMKAYLNNKYPDVSFSYSKGMASFTVPNEVSALNKQEKKVYVAPLYDRMITFSSNEDMKTVPTILVETQDGTPIARSAVFSSSGYKVYK